ncbi:hypothetical protein [Bradyrhizobium sp. Tv2a-2]|uniref:hypothetical protein n=1 Tax=Bradyrhizobium sp. Tv2a-2 TaxID=113395 RepID=UPI0012EBC2A3|nr:hypothetical protein [Bradyrhizobium sp. Tv2a-2]
MFRPHVLEGPSAVRLFRIALKIIFPESSFDTDNGWIDPHAPIGIEGLSNGYGGALLLRRDRDELFGLDRRDHLVRHANLVKACGSRAFLDRRQAVAGARCGSAKPVSWLA